MAANAVQRHGVSIALVCRTFCISETCYRYVRKLLGSQTKCRTCYKAGAKRKHYRQIDLEERCRLRGMMEQGVSITKIAHHLGRDRRTIQRELARNATAKGEYKPDTASRFSWARRLRGSRCQRCSYLHETVTSSLAMGWTPQQISGWLQHQHGTPLISHESIYRYIYSPHGRRLKLSRYLPHGNPPEKPLG